ncbi:hypothetical protein E4U48_006388 [Claviceps purpurea]|nr:hypothetical protein E4U28_006170 [Claviceps purpurea]KAG6281657.1 hypothetical protein E4U48_006388 [Claviceps purpurea]KAG6286764.1 hypothetical protein E4U46_004584 [Claviceps purpurea]
MSDPLFCCDAVKPFYIEPLRQGYEEKTNIFMDWAGCPLVSFDEKKVWDAMQGPWPFAVEHIKYVRYDYKTPSRWFLARKDTKDFYEVEEDDIKRENDSEDIPDQAAFILFDCPVHEPDFRLNIYEMN